jgi:peptide/nickel transport system substrate-binding protein
MKRTIAFAALIGLGLAAPMQAASQDAPKRGGTLNFAISAETPNYDCHAHDTFAAIHFLAPFYSTLLQFDLKKYPEVRGDLAESWTVAPDLRSYTFKLKPNVVFSDGQPLTSADIKATYDRIRMPPTGVVSARRATLEAIESIETPDPLTVVFKTSKVDTSLLQQFASPWNCVYSAAKLAENPKFPETNVMGTGPFRFTEHVRGSHVAGVRNDKYFVPGQPYLDGIRGNFMLQAAAMVNALQGSQVLGEFRGISPAERDRLKQAMGDKIRIEESAWTLNILIAFNTTKKPFDDVRVRQALSLAIDRYTGSQALSRTSTLRAVGGALRPGSTFATPEAELEKLPGFGKDIKANRDQARKLLAEAGASNLTFKLMNRTIAQPYTTAGIFLIDQWRQIGVNVEHVQQETSPYFAAINSGNFDVVVDFSNLFMDEPTLALAKYVSFDRAPENRSRAVDRELDALFDQQRQTLDVTARRNLLRQFETRALTQAYQVPLLWWHRIIATNQSLNGWVMSPSHTLGQDLAAVWLNQ